MLWWQTYLPCAICSKGAFYFLCWKYFATNHVVGDGASTGNNMTCGTTTTANVSVADQWSEETKQTTTSSRGLRYLSIKGVAMAFIFQEKKRITARQKLEQKLHSHFRRVHVTCCHKRRSLMFTLALSVLTHLVTVFTFTPNYYYSAHWLTKDW